MRGKVVIMKKILTLLLFALVFVLTGCLQGGRPGTIELYVDDELYATYEKSVDELLEVDIPEKEGMMFTGWLYNTETYFDSFTVKGNMKLYAQWEDPIEVFTYKTNPFEEPIQLLITEYTGDANFVVIPSRINNQIVGQISERIFEVNDVEVVFLPMDVELNGEPFEETSVRRVEFYGDYELPAKLVLGKEEYEELIQENEDVCAVLEENLELNTWKLSDGCPIMEVLEKSASVYIGDVEHFTYTVNVDRNIYKEKATHYLWSGAFKSNQLELLRLPNSFNLVTASMFGENESLQQILVNDENHFMASVDGVLYNKDQTKLLEYPSGKEDTEFSIPEIVTSIRPFAFGKTKFLETLNLHSEYTSDFIIRDATSLKSINVEEGNTVYHSDDGVLFKGNVLVKYPASKNGESYTVPNGTETIFRYAFLANISLEEVNLPDSLTKIQDSAFENTNSLTVLDVPSSVEYFGLYVVKLSSIETLIFRRDMNQDGSITMIIGDFGNYIDDYMVYFPDDSYGLYFESIINMPVPRTGRISDLDE